MKRSESHVTTDALWAHPSGGRFAGLDFPILAYIARQRFFPGDELYWSPSGHWAVAWRFSDAKSVVASGKHDGDVFEAFESLYADRLWSEGIVCLPEGA